MIVAIALVAVVAALRLVALRTTHTSPVERAGLLRGTYRLFPTAPGAKPDIALSPDGQTLAYVSAPDSKALHIYVQRAGEPDVSVWSGATRPGRSRMVAGRTRIAYCNGKLPRSAVPPAGSKRPALFARSTSFRPTAGDSCARIEWPLTRLRF